MKGVQESLADRVALLYKSPLSQREIVSAQLRPFTTDFEALAADSKIAHHAWNVRYTNIFVIIKKKLFNNKKARIYKNCRFSLFITDLINIVAKALFP